MTRPENSGLFEATTLDIGDYGKWSLADVLKNLNGGELRDQSAIIAEDRHEIEAYLKDARHYTVSQILSL